MDAVVEQASGPDLETCFAIRRRVFVDGQRVPEALELDGLDEACTHFIARVDGEPVGAARMRIVDGRAKAERVAVLAELRRCGTGRALMEALETAARRAGSPVVVLHAQLEAVPFYERLGYAAVGAVFHEAGIPHLPMQKPLRDSGSAGP